MNKSLDLAKGKREKIICGCCTKPEDFSSDQVIFDYFGREFTEYEYVIENLAIRPAPKKLLDLVPVHSANVSKTSSECNYLDSEQKMLSHYPNKQPTSGEGDFRKPRANLGLKIRDVSEDYITFKSDEDYKRPEPRPKQFGPKMLPYTDSPNNRVIKDIKEIQKTIRAKEYRTPKQVITDLCRASEESLKFNRPMLRSQIQLEERKLAHADRIMPTEIKDTIDTLKFRRPLSQYYTPAEKKIHGHSPGVFLAEVKGESINGDKANSLKEQSEDTIIDLMNDPNEINPISDNKRYYPVDSTAQTEISKGCPCLKKQEGKKNLKWKIIINKHAGNQC
ncbi:uncharacterized protein LOC126745928 [Anthonomus grandis grandis]|uniref:uncharacterized protein LOC126745928 n=1 Tax=Anthonomus grandis grandis TaxID=2921223 RepID=UPI002165EE9E|nr:uncharacterized protein LOC126745928 [Anthonomus grandis grandis]